jgi:dTDP-4-dehydrorhamnose reductase
LKILIFGSGGQVGWELLRTLQPFGTVQAYDFPEVDFSQPESLRMIIRDLKPEVIVNAAAHTAVDRAEDEQELAYLINADAPRILAEETALCNGLLIHYSTDYVFDGTKTSAYNENDIPNPLGVYGKTKLAGESAIAGTNCRHIIFRTSWVFGARGQNFLNTILRLASSRSELKIVNDQYGAPTWSRMLAEATAAVLSKISVMPSAMWESGIYNMTCAGVTSWYEFAKVILEKAQQRGVLKKDVLPQIIPIATHEYPVKAKRPANSLLNNEKLQKTFGLVLPSWNTCVNLVIDEMMLGIS